MLRFQEIWRLKFSHGWPQRPAVTSPLTARLAMQIYQDQVCEKYRSFQRKNVSLRKLCLARHLVGTVPKCFFNWGIETFNLPTSALPTGQTRMMTWCTCRVNSHIRHFMTFHDISSHFQRNQEKKLENLSITQWKNDDEWIRPPGIVTLCIAAEHPGKGPGGCDAQRRPEATRINEKINEKINEHRSQNGRK